MRRESITRAVKAASGRVGRRRGRRTELKRIDICNGSKHAPRKRTICGWRRFDMRVISAMNSRRAESVSRWQSNRFTAMRERRHEASYTSPKAPAPIRWPKVISLRSNSQVGRTSPGLLCTFVSTVIAARSSLSASRGGLRAAPYSIPIRADICTASIRAAEDRRQRRIHTRRAAADRR